MHSIDLLYSTFVIILSSSCRLFTMWRADMQGPRVEQLLNSVDCARSSDLDYIKYGDGGYLQVEGVID